MHPFQRPLLSKHSHSVVEVSSWIIPAPSSCRLLPVLLLSVWVCLCMRHSLLNSEEHRYCERTSEGMTQTSTFNFHYYISSRGEDNRIKYLYGEQRGCSGNRHSVTILKVCQGLSSDFQQRQDVLGVFYAAFIDFRLSPNWSVVACFHGYSQWIWKDVQEWL